MEEQEGRQTFFRIMIPILIIVAAVYIFKSGYKTGHWLYEITHQEQK